MALDPKLQAAQAQYKQTVLAKSELFSALEPRELAEIVALTSERSFKKRDVLFRKGDPGSSMLAVLSGRVQISTVSAEGKELTLNIIEAGQVVGELALLDQEPRSADAIAMVPGSALVIERRDFIRFLERQPAVAVTLLGVLSQKIRRASQMVEDLAFQELPARLARLLLRFADAYGRDAEDGVQIRLKLSQREIGNMVASSRESINKQLRAWQADGFVDVADGQITLLDLDALEEIAADEAGS